MKKALRTFRGEIAISAGDPSKMAKYAKKPLSSALRYLFWLLFCIAFVVSVWVCFTFSFVIPKIGPFILSTAGEVKDLYPANLIVRIQNGRLSTNMRNPVQIRLPEKIRTTIRDTKKPENPVNRLEYLVVIDTRATADDFVRHRTFVLLTDDTVIIPDNSGKGFRAIPLEAENDFVFTRQEYVKIIDRFLPIAQAIPAVAWAGVVVLFFVLPFVIAAGSFAFYLVYLLFWCLVAWLLATMMNRKHTYGEIYRLGAHALTLPLFYYAISFWFPTIRLPFIFTLIFLVWMGVVFGAEKVKKRKEA